MQGVAIKGTGKALPKKCVTNNNLSEFLETSDEWIVSRTGIHTRYIAVKETTTSLAIAAAKAALEDAGIEALTIDMIIVATITPDYMMPSTACCVQTAIGATNATAFDITAACSGFLYASKIAIESILASASKTVLVIGAEVLSKVVDWEDRGTCVLFGDGAGAAIYGAHTGGAKVSLYTRSDGEGGMNLVLPNNSTKNVIGMEGKAIYRFATTVVPESINTVIEQAGYKLEDIDAFILHQANERIIDSVAKKLNIEEKKFFKNIGSYGNTSGASIPIALAEARKILPRGSKVVLAGFGGGLTWGSMFIVLD